MRAARLVARAIGWLFVAVIGYHAVLAIIRATEAGSDGNWSRAITMAVIAVVATAIVVAAVVSARQSKRAG